MIQPEPFVTGKPPAIPPPVVDVVPGVGAVKVKVSALLVPAVVTAVTLAVVPVGSVGAVAEQVAPPARGLFGVVAGLSARQAFWL
jgi:hypothetical protein